MNQRKKLKNRCDLENHRFDNFPSSIHPPRGYKQKESERERDSVLYEDLHASRKTQKRQKALRGPD